MRRRLREGEIFSLPDTSRGIPFGTKYYRMIGGEPKPMTDQEMRDHFEKVERLNEAREKYLNLLSGI